MINPFDAIVERLDRIETILIKDNIREQKAHFDVEQLLTIKQAGELLNLSVPTLYSKVQKAEIPVCKRGGRLYFSKHELTAWIKSGRKKTSEEIEKEAESYLKQKGVNNA